MAGCGAIYVAEKLANYLESHAPTPGVKWTIFDRQLMQKVLEDHKLPTSLAKILSEDRTSFIQDTIADIFEVHPTADKMVKLISETILHGWSRRWKSASSASATNTTRRRRKPGITAWRRIQPAPVTSGPTSRPTSTTRCTITWSSTPAASVTMTRPD
jgi:hypothetical protein